MSYFMGVDIGSLTVKVVLVNEDGQILGSEVGRSGYRGKEIAGELANKVLSGKGLSREQLAGTVATGYGRLTYPADREVSEITCQARGVSNIFQNASTIIDIGGQDSKVIKVLPGGKVIDFAMNDKCAAGTGRFLEVMAGALEVDVKELGDLAAEARQRCTISSTCTVFAESEVISLIAQGADKADIVAGICAAVAGRVMALAARVKPEPEIVFTGGVALNSGVVAALAKELGKAILVPPEPEITAALGAALIARDYN